MEDLSIRRRWAAGMVTEIEPLPHSRLRGAVFSVPILAVKLADATSRSSGIPWTPTRFYQSVSCESVHLHP
jgi:hypothetical protein